ncbi:arginine--tRNA ligase [Clostridium sp. D53t1_180928_C8]|uniref:arginine--tRNA ligase n=1 Tax=Clostridium sp. D53t1_180928_C8 TaxID=2787101 RepID=UPI0018AA1109|nr:arginine--tRNA ligase [Clostridium sp. D53t1_180928_C8]
MNYKSQVAAAIKSQFDIGLETIEKLIEIPPNSEMGDYTFPCFEVAKINRRDPNIIAKDLQANIKSDMFEKIENIGPYLNFFINREIFIKNTLEEIIFKGDNYGKSDIGLGKTICIEYLSPNMCKEFGVENLCHAVLATVLSKLFEKEGYNVKVINHIKDWEQQLGNLIYSYIRWGDEEALEKNMVGEVLRIYHKFKKEAEKDILINIEGKKYFKALEEGNIKAISIWNRFKYLSLKEFKEAHNAFSIRTDSNLEESFYNNKVKVEIDKLKEKNLLDDIYGVKVIKLHKYNMPPAIVLRSDDIQIDIIKDLTAAVYKKEKYDFYKSIYVSGINKSLYFKQLFKVLELSGYEWENDCLYVGAGLIKVTDKSVLIRNDKSSTWKNMIQQVSSIILEAINEKNPTLENKKEIIKKLAIGEVIFTILNDSREKNIVFNFNKKLLIEGERILYVQNVYNSARFILSNDIEISKNTNFNKLNSQDEFELVKRLENFNSIIHIAVEKLDPSVIIKYVIEVTKELNKFYSSHLILSLEDKDLMKARLVLVEATCKVIKNALDLIGVEVVENI